MNRYITLPNGKQCGLGKYVSAWNALLALDAGARIAGFGHFAERADYVLSEIRHGMHDRINRHIGWYGRGRKWDGDWQRHARQCADQVNTPRLVVRWVPADLRARLAHRIAEGCSC